MSTEPFWFVNDLNRRGTLPQRFRSHSWNDDSTPSCALLELPPLEVARLSRWPCSLGGRSLLPSAAASEYSLSSAALALPSAVHARTI